jgi:xanthine dehydrogenase accessory factor
MKRSLLESIVASARAKAPLVLVTWLRPGRAHCWAPGDGDGGLPTQLRDAAERSLATDEAFTVETEDGPVLFKPFNPPLRLILVGAVQVAAPLSSIATTLGYAVTVVDPREAFARADGWPAGTDVRRDWPDQALRALRPDRRTAVVTLSHDPKIDDPSLRAALATDAFYIGALGSKKSHAARVERLAEAGVDRGQLLRIHGPVGLALGARTPGELAVAIVAQMTGFLRHRPAAMPPATQGAGVKSGAEHVAPNAQR